MNLLIDGSSLLHRVHWINQNKKFTNSFGKDVGDIFMFLTSVKFYAKTFNTKDIYIAWDKKLIWPSKNFRHQLSNDTYKAHRDKEKSSEVFLNEDDLVQFLNSLGIKNLYPRIMEADDIISWLCSKLDGSNMIISTDNDLLQLISDHTSFYHPFKKKIIDKNNFENEVGIKQESFLYYKAIMGDSSDNIDGIPSYGKVRSKKLADDLIKDPNNIKQLSQDNINILERNLTLIDLSKGYTKAGIEEVKSYEEQLNQLNDLEADLTKFEQLCKSFEFNKFLTNIYEWKGLFQNSRLISIINSLGVDK